MLATAMMAELSEKGAGREQVILDLLDQGADVNYCNKVGLVPILSPDCG